MAGRERVARLSPRFLARVEATGLSDMAIAAAIGVSRQFYADVKAGKQNPTTRFMAGAIRAGLGESFDDVAEPLPERATA